ncbi:arylsulfatase I isoform X2 [Plutella xylostella]|uniref:arylsulfatase I isoform X2 n=1 Tax=Plutella xylostella TaxID=51655 RepID=UPI0020325CC0|nr:arylsulfatase I isoform X2 [Plutella xylostella]
MGWNDVGFHGLNQVGTPNLDALAYSGRVLHNYYVNPICTPSRAALFTGKHPIHTGMQHSVLFDMEPRGLPLSEKLLPQHLKELGYSTHLVGKWHLGFFKKEYLPLNRGFESHLGFWTGRIDHFDHVSMEKGTWGTDFRRGFDIAHDLYGQYVTDIFTEESVKIIRAHNQSTPLFLTIAHSAVHSGNPPDPIRAPHRLVETFRGIEDLQRQKFAAVLSKLDSSVGAVTAALSAAGMLENTLLIFTTDNGGAAAGFNDNVGSNWPLRGVKNTLWEGGVRGAGLVWGASLPRGSLVTGAVQMCDWLPTIYRAAGGDVSTLGAIDGVDVWGALAGAGSMPPRRALLHNIDDIWGSAAITVDQWKLVKGTNHNGTWDGWYGPDGREGSYDVDAVYKSPAGVVLQKGGYMPDKETILALREQATVSCKNVTAVPCEPLQAPCLFNVQEDPCEMRNLAEEYPEVQHMLLSRLQEFNRTAVPPGNFPYDSSGDPKHWGRVFTNFGDYLPISV